MDIRKALRLGIAPRLALVGAGGKTSLMFSIARSYTGRVIVTTTTHLSRGQTKWGDIHFVPKSVKELSSFLDDTTTGIIVLTGQFEGNRVTGLNPKILTWLAQYSQDNIVPLLIEADGSRQLPLKAPGSHEPAIPSFVDLVIVMAGLSAVGKPLSAEWVHRPERFSAIGGIKPGEPITPVSIVKLLSDSNGGLKNIPANARRIVFLCQVDRLEPLDVTDSLANELLACFNAVISGSFDNDTRDFQNKCKDRSDSFPLIGVTVQRVQEPIAGIILAAGGAKRYGRPKQLLEWQSKSLVWHAAQKALKAGLQKVIVVSGAFPELIEEALREFPVEIVHNPNWNQGQGTSVSVGVQSLPTNIGAAIFILADQPLIPVNLIDKLVNAHQETLSPIIAPFAGGKRANPVLFDRELFQELVTLTGDMGGRQLFDDHDILHIHCDDPNEFLDIDSPEDYQRLMGLQK
jgi:molybdenum cofactor cytidylyltransferase